MPVYSWRDCPPEIRAQVEDLCGNLCGQLGSNLVGLYLHGSLALGSFNPLRSDLDILGLVENTIEPAQRRALGRLFLECSRRPAAVEISLLRRSDITPWRYPTPFDFHYSESWRARMEAGLAMGSPAPWQDSTALDTDLATHITLALRRGVCLFGPPAEDVFPLPPAVDFLASLLEDVLSPEYGLDAAASTSVNVLLNACRTLAYLHHGAILSKAEGGEWGLAHLPPRYHPLIRLVLHAYRDEPGDPLIPGAELHGFVEYLRTQIKAG